VETCHGRGNGGTHEELYFGEGRVILRKKKALWKQVFSMK